MLSPDTYKWLQQQNRNMLACHLGAMPSTLPGYDKKEMNTHTLRKGGEGKERLILTWNLMDKPSLRPHSFSSASLQGPSGWTGYSLTCLFWFWFPSVGNKHLKSEATNIPTTTSLHSGSKKKANFCWCSKDVLKQNFRVLPAGKEWAGHQQALLPSSQHCRICSGFLLGPSCVSGCDPAFP